MTKISDLPRDLADEVLSRLPVTSLRAIRFTCKKWNTLTKRRSFTKKQIGWEQAEAKKKQEKELEAIMIMNDRVYLMSVNPDGIHKDDDNVESSIKQKGKLISLNGGDQVVISQVYHCDGLLLCITNDNNNSRLVVWNPYFWQTRLIEPRESYHKWDNYALGYGIKKSSCNRSNIILRYLDAFEDMSEMSVEPPTRICQFEIYHFDSNSWMVIEDIPDWNISHFSRGVSLKGMTYWFAQERILPLEEEIEEIPGEIPELREIPSFLLCFDFTTEKFGSLLPLPFQPRFNDTVTLSTIREEKLTVLYHRWDTAWTGIWISNKIEPNAVSWSSLFLPIGRIRPFEPISATFFVDEEKKLAVIFDKRKSIHNPTRNTAYIVGEDGYCKQVDLGESSVHSYCFPVLVCSYVPSCVQI
ncbi:PREDICTED: F-box protein At3g17320-like [Camelina sativa]|uniref:F-box protein At3g17320-like n=1 Tax=Camelina sativa TaxID=90675 RepID=A0ABM0XRL0_CAMSA|nr:PREDICTED: F-box protein At3g17320-like [Camelina sativa]